MIPNHAGRVPWIGATTDRRISFWVLLCSVFLVDAAASSSAAEAQTRITLSPILRTALAKQSEIALAPICVTCPHRASGFCATVFGPPEKELKVASPPSWQRFKAARAGEQIAVRNQASEDVFVLCAGWAFRYLQLSDGRRQILQFLLPGDIFSPVSIFEKASHFSVKAVTPVRLSGLARSEVRGKFAISPDVQSAVANFCIEETRGAAKLLTALGQLSAEERIAYLLLHLMARIAARNVIRGQRYPLPLRQQHIADAVGLTPVHVSRVFSLFRERRVLALSDGVLEVFNLPELERIGTLR